jgi:hypothetical protein
METKMKMEDGEGEGEAAYCYMQPPLLASATYLDSKLELQRQRQANFELGRVFLLIFLELN